MLPPLINSTIQSCVLNATSNIIAQFITLYRTNSPLTIDWRPVFQFALFNALSCPPNFLWQSFLESAFPSTYLVPSKSAVSAASSNDEHELDREEKTHEILESKLSLRNTIIKFLLDQSLGAAVNIVLYSMAMAGFRGASYSQAVSGAKEEFFPLMVSGWKLWPAVSLLNFTVVRSVEGRQLVGSIAGLFWGVMLSLKESS